MKKWWKKVKKEWDVRTAAIIIISTLLIVLSKYHLFPWQPTMLRGLVFYLALPLLAVVFIFREKLKDFGWSIGNWKLGLKYWGLAAIVLAVLFLVTLLFPSIVFFYSRDSTLNLLLMRFLFYAVFIFGWEYLFRGFMLFGLEKKFGNNAIFIVLIPFVLLHIPAKPEIETLSSIVGGIILGWIALKTRSFWPAWLIHITAGFFVYAYNFIF